MHQLEEGLASYHAKADAASTSTEKLKPEDILEAFACVTLVHPGSPADISVSGVKFFKEAVICHL